MNIVLRELSALTQNLRGGDFGEALRRHAGSVDGLGHMIIDAAVTDRKLPAAHRLGVKGFWPDITPDKMGYGYADVELRWGGATAAEVTKYDLVGEALRRVDVETAKHLWLVANSAIDFAAKSVRERGPRWQLLAKMTGKHPQTIKRRWERGLADVWVAC